MTDPEGARWFLCAAMIVRDEARHIEEWIAYHHLIGVEHVFVYDNDSTDNLREVLAPYITRGLVTYIYWPHFPGQVDAYAHAVRMTAPFTEWLCLFDADEFLALKGIDDLHAHLRATDCDQILVRWRMFGHSGHRQPQPGLTIDTFVHCAPAPMHIVKAIVRPATVKEAFVHYSRTQRRRSCDTRGTPVREAWSIRANAGAQPLELHHYYTRSYEEYVAKMERGDANRGEVRPVESFERWDFAGRDEGLRAHAPAVRAFVEAARALPARPLRTGTLAGSLTTAAQPTLGNWTDRLLDDLVQLAAATGAGETRLLRGGDGSALAIADPPVGLFDRLRDAAAAPFDALVAERGLVPIGVLSAPARSGCRRERLVHDVEEPFVLPGCLLALLVIGPTADIQTVRLRLSGTVHGETRQQVESVGVAPDTLVVTVRVLPVACRAEGIEVRWIDQFEATGAVDVRLALIA